MRLVFCITVLVAIVSTGLNAQKKIGYYNGDSLLRLMPGYLGCLDSTRMYNDSVRVQIAKMEKDRTAKQREMDSLKGKDSPLMRKLREEQLRQITENIGQFQRKASAESRTLDSLRKAPYEQRLFEAKNAAAKKNNCTAVYDKKAINLSATVTETIYLDLNAAVAEELHL